MIWAHDAAAYEFQFFNGRQVETVCTGAGNSNSLDRSWFADGCLPWLGDVSYSLKSGAYFKQVFLADLSPPKDEAQPSPPFILNATPSAGRVFLSWDHILGADGYNVYYARESGVTPQNYTTLDGGARVEGVSEPYAVSGLPDPATYYFVVTSVENGTEGPESVESSARPLPDCNLNGVEDSVDIEFGISNDSNANGIPDECEQTPTFTPTPTELLSTPTSTMPGSVPTFTETPTLPSLTSTPTCQHVDSDFDMDGSQRIDALDLIILLEAIQGGSNSIDFDCSGHTGSNDLFQLTRKWKVEVRP
jgi:hypothetical protein